MKRHMALVIIFAILLTSVCLLVGWFFISMETLFLLPKGERIATVCSSDGAHCIHAYRVRGNATMATAIRCEVKGRALITHNLYWAYRTQDVNIVWLDDRTAEINGIPIDIFWGQYDYRKELAHPDVPKG